MATVVDHQRRVYSVCFYEHDLTASQVVMIDAATDEEALAEASIRRSFTTREIWNGHRLVGVIPPAQ